MSWHLVVIATAFTFLSCHQQLRPEEPVVSTLPKRCVVPAPQPQAAEIKVLWAQARDRGFLWKVKHGSATSWLFGTIHVNKPEWSVPGPQLIQAVQQSDVIAFEMSPDQMKAAAESVKSTSESTGPAAPVKLDPFVRAALESLCLPSSVSDNLAKFPKWVQGASLVIFDASRVGLWAGWGSEQVLSGFATAAKKPIVGLETQSEQTNAVASVMGDDDQLHQLSNLIIEQKASASLEAIAKAWAEGNLERLSLNDICPTCASDPKATNALRKAIVDRNAVQAERFMKLLDGGKNVFCAVGAMHLVGEEGIPALLKKKGYVVERVVFTEATNEMVFKPATQ